jgi:hypothetical protein
MRQQRTRQQTFPADTNTHWRQNRILTKTQKRIPGHNDRENIVKSSVTKIEDNLLDKYLSQIQQAAQTLQLQIQHLEIPNSTAFNLKLSSTTNQQAPITKLKSIKELFDQRQWTQSQESIFPTTTHLLQPEIDTQLSTIHQHNTIGVACLEKDQLLFLQGRSTDVSQSISLAQTHVMGVNPTSQIVYRTEEPEHWHKSFAIIPLQLPSCATLLKQTAIEQ